MIPFGAKHRKERQKVLRKSYTLCMRLTERARVRSLLRETYLCQNALIRRTEAVALAKRLKEDFLILKNFFLMGVVNPVDQSGQ